MTRRTCAAVVVLLFAGGTDTRPAAPLRVCADPDNAPFTSREHGGFEIDIVRLLARDLARPLEFTWWPQRRGFLRNTLLAGACDVVPGYPSGADAVRTSRPYYRSTYVFVTRRGAPITGFDDPRLRRVRIGVPLVGDGDGNAPPSHALSRRGIMSNVRAFPLSADRSGGSPPIVAALTRNDIDVAIAWGPAVGFFAASADPPLDVRAVTPATDGAIPEVYDISMAVRRDDAVLFGSIEQFIARRRPQIEGILRRYGVPLLPLSDDTVVTTTAGRGR